MSPSGGPLVIVLILVSASDAYLHASCNIRCCAFSPACDNATSMTCTCPNTDQLTLRANSIPDSVQYIHLTGVRYVTISGGAVTALHQLRELTVRDVQQLMLNADALAVQLPSQLQLVRISDIRHVTLARDALSGHWPSDVQITIQRVQQLRLNKLALHFRAESPGPRALLEHVAVVSAQRDALRAHLSQLSLANVSLAVCQPGTFGGRINNLEILGSRLQSLETGCYRPALGQPLARLAIRSSTLGKLAPRALTGNVSELLLEACNVSKLAEMAVQMRVGSLELKTTHVSELLPRGLDVIAQRSIMLRDSWVGVLHQAAFAALRLDTAHSRSPDAELRPFSIHSVHFGRAMDGALSVHPDVATDQINWDSLVFDTPCSCGLSDLVRRWVTGSAEPPPAGSQRRLVSLVYRAGFCSAQGRPQPLARAESDCPNRLTPREADSDVGDGEGPSENGGGGGSVSMDQNIVFYGVLAGVALLLVIAVATVCTRRRRRKRHHSEVPPSSVSTAHPPPPPAGKLPDLLQPAAETQQPEHIYAEIRPPAPAPQLAEYADPRDACCTAQPSGGVYAEISPLIGPDSHDQLVGPASHDQLIGRASHGRRQRERPPTAATQPVGTATLPVGATTQPVMADNRLYAIRGPVTVTVTDL